MSAPGPRGRSDRTESSETAAVEDAASILEASEDFLADWSDDERGLFIELLEDAESDLQREMIHRGLTAGRDAHELHSFADAIRGLSDEAVFKECTPPRSGHPLTVLLAAQADPLAAFELNGNGVRKPGKPPRARTEGVPLRIPAALFVEHTQVGYKLKPPTFNASADVDARAPDANDLGRSRETAPPAGVKGKFSEDLFNRAGKALDVKFDEQAVDEGPFTLERAVAALPEALALGIPVPILLGTRPGDFRRYALILQVQTSGKNRAYQLYEPVSGEAVWANEGDLLHRKELPFEDKVYRRITAIALPRLSPGAPGPNRRDSAFEGQG